MPYTPSQILSIFESVIAANAVNRQSIELSGVYRQGNGHLYNHYFYDVLGDEFGTKSIKLKIHENLRQQLTPNNLIKLTGCIERSISDDGRISLTVLATDVEITRQQVLNEDDARRIELRNQKMAQRSKNVDLILESKLLENQQPVIALVFAETSITDADFNAGINAARASIMFEEERVSFANSRALISLLTELDGLGYDAIAIIRGGGTGIEALDNVDVLERIVTMNTPIISAIGHVNEQLFFKQVVDKLISTPNGLGQYFSEMVERITMQREQSIERITTQIRNQFQQQITSRDTQIQNGNRERERLMNQITQLTTSYQQNTQQLNTTIQQQRESIDRLNHQLQLANTKSGNVGVWQFIAIVAIIVAIIAFII